MFRRREDGTEELISDAEGAASATPHTNNTASGGATSSTASTPSAPSAPSAPAAPAQAAQAFRPVPPQAAMAASRPTPPAMAPSAPTPSMASDASRGAAANAAPSAQAPRANPKRVLTVGPDIQMKGEITTCDRVVIEGVVDATMRDVHTVELTETGSLKGTADVEDAEISGTFEGDLVVRGKLTVYSSGRVRGNVTYGEIEIQRGGQISGNIRNVADAKTGGSLPQPQQKAKAA